MECHQWTWSTTRSTETSSFTTISIRTLSTWRHSSSFWWPASSLSTAAITTCPKNIILCSILDNFYNSGSSWKSRDKDTRSLWAKDTTSWTQIRSKLSMEITSASRYSSSLTSSNRSCKSTPRTGCLLCKLWAIRLLLVMTRYHCHSALSQMIGSKQSETISWNISVPCKDRVASRPSRTIGISKRSRRTVLKAFGLKCLHYQNPVSMASVLTSSMSSIRRVGSSFKCISRLWSNKSTCRLLYWIPSNSSTQLTTKKTLFSLHWLETILTK